MSTGRRFLLLLLALWILPAFAIAQPTPPDDATKTLFQAIQRGDLPVVTRLLDGGVSANAAMLGIPALYFAQMSNQPASMKLLLARGADVHTRYGPAQRTALHDAALKGRTECVKILLEAGADPNAPNTFGQTPLGYVTNPPLPLTRPQNAEEVAALLRQHGAK